MESQYTNLIERYYDGLLTKEETAEFNELKETNVDFQNELSLFEKSQLAAELYALQQLKENARQIDKATISMSTKPKRNWVKIAASVLVISLIGAVIYAQKSFSNKGLYANAYTPVEDYVSDLGGERTSLEAALQFYNQEKYVMAIDAFTEIEKVEPENPVVKFYLGHSFLLANKSDQGISKLTEVTGAYQPEAQWHAALALLNKDEEDKCRLLLNEIINTDKDQTFVEKAKRLKSKLNSSWRKWVIF